MISEDTPLHFAAKGRGNIFLFKGCGDDAPKIAELLLDHGALFGAKNSAGETPLILAALHDKHELVEYLISRPECSVAEKVDALLLLGARYSDDEQVCMPAVIVTE